ASYVRGKVTIDGDNHLRIPDKYLLDLDRVEPTPAFCRNVACTEILDRLNIDRAAEPRLQPTRSARVIDARSFVFRDPIDSCLDGSERLFRVSRKRFWIVMRQRAQKTKGGYCCFKSAVEQRIGDSGLLLHARRERGMRRCDRSHIDDEIGF